MNPDHLKIFQRGVDAWNEWRRKERQIWADLSELDFTTDFRGLDLSGTQFTNTTLFKANLVGANLTEATFLGSDVRRANLTGAVLERAKLLGTHLDETELIDANLSGAMLINAHMNKTNLTSANLTGSDIGGANLFGANLSHANFSGACLYGTNLSKATLFGTNLTGADLQHANLVDADLSDADLTGCRVYGISAWGLKLDERTKQQNLIITPYDDPAITVDNIEVAQFVYLLLNNAKIRDVIDTIGNKGVLLLGRFTEGRIAVLERLREELRKRGFLPMILNFDKPMTKNFTETVRLLAGMSRFVIADITNPKSSPLELQATVPECMVPFVPILDINEDREPFPFLGICKSHMPTGY